MTTLARHRNGGTRNPVLTGLWIFAAVMLAPIVLVFVMSTLLTFATLAVAFFQTIQGI